jgi:hypothetical protein
METIVTACFKAKALSNIKKMNDIVHNNKKVFFLNRYAIPIMINPIIPSICPAKARGDKFSKLSKINFHIIYFSR